MTRNTPVGRSTAPKSLRAIFLFCLAAKMAARLPADTTVSPELRATLISAHPPATTNTVSPPKSPTTTYRFESRRRRTEPPLFPGGSPFFGGQSHLPAFQPGTRSLHRTTKPTHRIIIATQPGTLCHLKTLRHSRPPPHRNLRAASA